MIKTMKNFTNICIYNTDSIWLSSFDFPFAPALFEGGCSDEGDGAVFTIFGTKKNENNGNPKNGVKFIAYS